MNISSQRQEYLHFNIKSVLSCLKDNMIKIIFLLFVGGICYQVHLDRLAHASDKFISLSEGWESLNSGKHMLEMINACEVTQNAEKKL